jgi:hypothetical protein
MSWLSITVPGFVTVTEPCTTVSFVPGGTPVFVGPGLPGGSGTVGDAVGLGVGFGVTVGFAVGFGVGLGFGFGFVVGLTNEGEADDEDALADDADVDAGAVDEPGTTDAGALETDDDVPGSDEAGADELAGGSDCDEPTLLEGARSITAATISPPSSTSTSEMTTTRSRAEPGNGMAVRPP